MATFLNDTFTGANGGLLSAHTPDSGGSWTQQTGYATGVYTVQTNRIFAGPTGGNAVYQASGSPATPDYEVTATIRIVSAANVDIGVIGRAAAAAQTFYITLVKRVASGPTWTIELYKCVAGSFTTLGSFPTIAAPTVGTDHTLKLSMVGSAIAAYWDGVLTSAAATDTAITAAGKAGIYSDLLSTTSTGFHIDTITATDIGLGKIFSVNQAVNRAAYF